MQGFRFNNQELVNREFVTFVNMAGGRQWIILCAMLSLTWPQGSGERVLGEETDEFDFDGLPGAQHEFKIEIKPGHIECFYQKIVQGGKIHVSFEVSSIFTLYVLPSFAVFMSSMSISMSEIPVNK